MAEVFLRRLSRWQAEPQCEAIADVHVTAYQGAWGEEFHDREGFVRTFSDALRQPGFDMVVAGTGQRMPVGCVYGFLADRAGTWWHSVGVGVPWSAVEVTSSGQVFAVAELMVVPSHRRQGLATRLVGQLLTRTTAAVAVSRVETVNDTARKVLSAWGWRRAGEYDEGSAKPESEAWVRTLKT